MFVEPSKVEIMEIDIPAPGPGQVLIEVASCGLCHTDLPWYQGKVGLGIDGSGKMVVTPPSFPFPAGHEPNGIVVEVGPGVTDFKVGDRVGSAALGGFATHVLAPVGMTGKVPDKLPLETTLMEPVGACAQITHSAHVELGDRVAVVGAGFMGLLVIAALSKFPLRELIAIDILDEKLEWAKKMGATVTINPTKEDVVARVLELTDGVGANPVIEITGHYPAIKTAASIIKEHRGKLLIPSLYGQTESLDAELGMLLMIKGPMLMSTHPAWSPSYLEEMRIGSWALNAGLFPVSELITHTFKFDQIQEAFDTLVNPPQGFVKGVVFVK